MNTCTSSLATRSYKISSRYTHKPSNTHTSSKRMSILQYKLSVSVLEGSESLLEDLETSLNSLLHTIFPGMFQSPPLLPPITPSSPSATAEVGSPSPTTPHTESHPEATSGVPLSPGLLSAPTDPLVTSALSSRHSTPQSDNEVLIMYTV